MSSPSLSLPNLPATYRALVQEEYAQPPVVKHLPLPPVPPGAALVRICYASILSYSRRIYDGSRKYPYPTPLTLGASAVGRICALPADATSLRLDDLVLLDVLVRSRDQPRDAFLAGIHAGWTPGAQRLMRDVWRHGTYAEYALFPLENCFRVPAGVVDPTTPDGGGRGLAGADAAHDLLGLTRLLVPYGGLADVRVQPGDTVIVAPATGGFGGAAVRVALAMGAGRVVAMGRNEAALARVVRDGHGRVVGVPMAGTSEEQLAALKRACGGGDGGDPEDGKADVFFDISPQHASDSPHFRACLLAVRQGGRVSLMGGQRDDVRLPVWYVMHWNITIKGKWMYEREDVVQLMKMVSTGQLDLGEGAGRQCRGTFGLDEWERAFERAEKVGGDGHVLMKP